MSTMTDSAAPPATPVATELPERPVVTIRPPRGRARLGLSDIWEYRELLLFLVWRDLKVRYRQTALGVIWAIIQPLFAMIIFTLFFGRLAGMPSDGVPYALFAYAGLLPWTFFSNAVTTAGNSLIGSSTLITKVYFPRMLVPGAAVGAGLVDLAIAFVTFVPLMVYYHAHVTAMVAVLPLLVVLTAALALAIGLLSAGLNVKYRDIRHALPFMVQILLFATPVIYPASIVPARFRWVLGLNPMAGIIGGYRAALLGVPMDWAALAQSAALTFVLLLYALYAFRKMERWFADLI